MKVCFVLNNGTAIGLNDNHPWVKLYGSATHRKHQLVDSPDIADIVVFTESAEAKRHVWDDFIRTETYLKHSHKSVVYNERDVPYPIYPGIYTSIRANLYDGRFYRSVPYMNVFTQPQEQITLNCSRKYLYCFLGSVTHPIRRRLLEGRHASDTVVENTHALKPYDVYGNPSHWDTVKRAQSRMLELFRESSFVLCPPGGSPNTYRIYEAMSCGAIPVIMSDDLVLPFGVDWHSCSVRIAERSLSDIDSILRAINSPVEIQAKVFDVYQQRFSRESKFDYLVDCIESLTSNGNFQLTLGHKTKVQMYRILGSIGYRLKRQASAEL